MGPTIDAAGSAPQVRLLRMNQIVDLVPVSPATIWRWIRQGRFPAGTRLSRNITVWPAEVVERWVEQNTGGSKA